MKRILSAVLLFALSVWLAWPMLNFSTYPHVPGRAYGGMLLTIAATALLPRKNL